MNNCFTKLIPHEIALWCCKLLISLYILYERCGLVINAL